MRKIYFIFLTILISIATTSCANRKNLDNSEMIVIEESKPIESKEEIDDSPKNVQITITHHIPYCGGAAPTYEMENNFTLVSAPFVIIDTLTGVKFTKSSVNGILNLDLKPGYYKLMESYKDVPFDEFYQKNGNTPSGPYYQQTGMECYKLWWKKALIEFEVKADAPLLQLQTGTSSSCFTGSNPCVYYNGPLPN